MTPKPPNFVELAVWVLGREDLTAGEAVEFLTALWNARGAADVAALEALEDLARSDRAAVVDAIRELDQ